MGMTGSSVQKKVLIVEDDRSLNELLRYNLVKNGFDAQCVYDGLVAQEKLRTEVFDVVILDVMLPGVDGLRLCKSIKENQALFRTFVIVLTAKSEPEDTLYGNLMGADYYLIKPFGITRLMEIIRELVMLRESRLSVAAIITSREEKGGGTRAYAGHVTNTQGFYSQQSPFADKPPA
jgi:DNA-binding response OmpR family regulator